MKTVQFGVLTKSKKGLKPSHVPVDAAVQDHLEAMFQASDPKSLGREVREYELAEKYTDDQAARLALSDPLAQQLKELYEHANLDGNPDVLNSPEDIKAYFCTITSGNTKVLGIKQATQFKILHKKFLTIFTDGQLGIENRQLFKIDERWDLVIDGSDITILSATALERICDLTPQIRQSAVQGLTELAPKMPYLEVEPLKERVEKFTRSARIVADLRKRGDLTTVTVGQLSQESTRQKLEYEVKDGRYIVKVGSEEGLLMLLDRRRYADPLVAVDPDIYEADSRHKVGKK